MSSIESYNKHLTVFFLFFFNCFVTENLFAQLTLKHIQFNLVFRKKNKINKITQNVVCNVIQI